MIDLNTLHSFNAEYSHWLSDCALYSARIYFKRPWKRLSLRLDGWLGKPDEPVIFAMNHTHEFDFLPPRIDLKRRFGFNLHTWIKARAFQKPMQSRFLKATGNIPVCSKGYILCADFYQTLNRLPSNHEYRLLRAYIDSYDPMIPNGPDSLAWLQTKPRSILGQYFSPSQMSYREAILSAYQQLMQVTVEKSRNLMAQGGHLQFYPQGSYAERLTAGHIGLVQAALATQAPICLVGLSGMNTVFRPDSLYHKPGVLTLRYAQPFKPKVHGLPDSFIPFNPAHERKFGSLLKDYTQTAIMQPLNSLLESDCNFQVNFRSNRKQGVDRFL